MLINSLQHNIHWVYESTTFHSHNTSRKSTASSGTKNNLLNMRFYKIKTQFPVRIDKTQKLFLFQKKGIGHMKDDAPEEIVSSASIES